MNGISWLQLKLCCLVLTLISGCQLQKNDTKIGYHFLPPVYDGVKIRTTIDTCHFDLDEDMYNQIESSSTFVYSSKRYMSFYDETSLSFGIFDFDSQRAVKRIYLKDVLDGIGLYKVSAYVINFDSILVSNKDRIYLMDSAGTLKKVIEVDPAKPVHFDNANPPVFKEDKLIYTMRMKAKETSLKQIRKWQVFQQYDLKKNSVTMAYKLPNFYGEDYYGRRLMQQYFCINRDGRFVISFAADSLIYETDLSGYNQTYFAKSMFQDKPIPSIKRNDLIADQGFKQSMLRDTYGPIFYDGYNKRYLRVFKRRVVVQDRLLKRAVRDQSIIVLNDKFKIIGEHELDGSVDTESLIIDTAGNIFARVRRNDEYAIHMIRLSDTGADQSKQLVKQ